MILFMCVCVCRCRRCLKKKMKFVQRQKLCLITYQSLCMCIHIFTELTEACSTCKNWQAVRQKEFLFYLVADSCRVTSIIKPLHCIMSWWYSENILFAYCQRWKKRRSRGVLFLKLFLFLYFTYHSELND